MSRHSRHVFVAALAIAASLAGAAARAGDTYKIATAEVVVVCPLTVGGSFEAKTRKIDGELAPGGGQAGLVVIVRLERCAVDISALLGLLRNRERVDGGEADLARRMYRRIKQSLRSQYAAGVHQSGYDRLTDLERLYHDTIRAANAELRSKVHTVPGTKWANDLASALSTVNTTIHLLRRGGSAKPAVT